MDTAPGTFVRAEPECLHDGNVSPPVAAVLREAARFAAIERVLATSGHPAASDAELATLRAELAGDERPGTSR